jgi:hypothetical protein
MKQRRRRLNWVRATRDPGVAAAYERSAQASADWHRALLEALRFHLDSPLVTPFPAASSEPIQHPLPFDDLAPLRHPRPAV